MPGLFVFESLWLGLAASFNAAEHTIGTRGWGKKKKSRDSFPLESVHYQTWTSGSGAQVDRGWERLGGGFSLPRSPLCAMKSLVYAGR